MVSTYKPIAGISESNQGSVNTVTTIILIITSLMISTIRFVIGRQKLLNLELDDAVFIVALLLAIIASVLSQRMVPMGLGQHQVAVVADDLSQFFKVQYTTGFLVILSTAASKASLVLMYRRIMPQLELTTKVLLPLVVAYAVTAMFLVAFQCSPPQPWVLEPLSCSTGGRTHYGAIGLNIFTDAILAFWIVPIVFKLQASVNKKLVVTGLVVSRFLVCAADVGRIVFVRKALRSDDVTWTSLGWAVMDQLIVHLSLNHATLPRVQTFLTSLQTGLLVPRLTKDDNVYLNSYGPGLRYGSGKIPDETQLGTKTGRSGFFKSMKQNGARQSVSMHPDAHDSKTQLRLQPDHGNEMSTFVTVGDSESTSCAGNMKADDKGGVFESWAEVNEPAITSALPSQSQGILMQHTVEIRESQA